ncbi:hypothetical protein LV779_15670 [Streptomyces thinghirensis]|nr:hypothetical protein [Streptomyces thinghirensis]
MRRPPPARCHSPARATAGGRADIDRGPAAVERRRGHPDGDHRRPSSIHIVRRQKVGLSAPAVAPVHDGGRLPGAGSATRPAAGSVLTLLLLVVAAFVTTLMAGHTFYPAGDVLRVVMGERVPAPPSLRRHGVAAARAVLALTAGFSFSRFRRHLRRCSATRSPAGPIIIARHQRGSGRGGSHRHRDLLAGRTEVSVMASPPPPSAWPCFIYTSAFRDGVAGTRLILIGIGVAALLADSVGLYVLSQGR